MHERQRHRQRRAERVRRPRGGDRRRAEVDAAHQPLQIRWRLGLARGCRPAAWGTASTGRVAARISAQRRRSKEHPLGAAEPVRADDRDRVEP